MFVISKCKEDRILSGGFSIRRGIAVLLAGGALLVVGLAVIGSSIASHVSVADLLPRSTSSPDITTKLQFY